MGKIARAIIIAALIITLVPMAIAAFMGFMVVLDHSGVDEKPEPETQASQYQSPRKGQNRKSALPSP